MSDRLKAMRRIAALQAQQKRLAEWRLAAVDQRKAALETAERDLAGFIADRELTGPLAVEALKQTQRLAGRVAVTAQQRAIEAAMVTDADRRLKLSEGTVERLAAVARADAERRALEASIEAFVGRIRRSEGPGDT